MRKILLLLPACLLTISTFSQQFQFSPSDVDTAKAISKYKGQAPANFDLKKVKPHEIPNENVLRSLGLSDAEIKEALRIKYGKAKVDTTKQKRRNERDFFESRKDTFNVNLLDTKLDTLGKSDLDGTVYGHDIIRKSRLSVFEKAKDIVAPDNYILGVGDEINISVWGFSFYNEVFQINQDGFIAPTNIGRIYLKGLTFGKAKELIKGKFSQFLDLRNSSFDITLSYSRVITVNIVGEVMQPGSYTLPAINSAFNALIASGGPNDLGSLRSIFIKRSDKKIDTLDIYDFLMTPGKATNIYLNDYDYLIVPVQKNVVKVDGEVRRPHYYELRKNEGLLEAIKFAGGLSSSAYTSIVQIKRFGHNEEILIDVNLDSLRYTGVDFPMKDGDEVLVKSIPKGYTNNVKVSGAVKIPGDYQLSPGDRLNDLLMKAEGLTIHAFQEKAYLIRYNEDLSKTYLSVNLREALNNKASSENIELKAFDHILIRSKEDFEDDYFVNVYGAVRLPGEFPYGEGLSLNDILFLSGGLKKEAANNRIEISRIVNFQDNQLVPVRAVVMTAQVSGDLGINEEAENFKLQPFDRVYIRVNPDFEPPINVQVQGEVMYPGAYSLLRKDETIANLIERAGGLKEYAFLDGAYIVREDIGTVSLDLEKALKKPKSKYNLVLNENDTIYIPKTLDLVHIIGEIGTINNEPISAPYFGGRAGYYVRKFAGGFDKDSHKSNVSVIYPNGIVRSTTNFGLFKVYPRVAKGATVNVPLKPEKPEKKDREPVNWDELLKGTSGAIITVLTFWILINNATK